MDDRKFGDIATEKLFENDRVRIWEMRLQPGGKSDLHEHEHDYVMIQISGDRMGADMEPDSAHHAEVGRIEVDISPGTVFFAPKGGKETAINVGTEPWHEIIVELLD